MYLKKCEKCKEIKIASPDLSESQFTKHPATRDGYQPLCRDCDKKRLKELYAKNIEINRAKRKQWQEDHHDEHLEHVRSYRRKKAAQKETKTKSNRNRTSKNGIKKTPRKSYYERWKEANLAALNREATTEQDDN